MASSIFSRARWQLPYQEYLASFLHSGRKGKCFTHLVVIGSYKVKNSHRIAQLCSSSEIYAVLWHLSIHLLVSLHVNLLFWFSLTAFIHTSEKTHRNNIPPFNIFTNNTTLRFGSELHCAVYLDWFDRSLINSENVTSPNYLYTDYMFVRFLIIVSQWRL